MVTRIYRKGRRIIESLEPEQYEIDGLDDATAECRLLLDNPRVTHFSASRSPFSDVADRFWFSVDTTDVEFGEGVGPEDVPWRRTDRRGPTS